MSGSIRPTKGSGSSLDRILSLTYPSLSIACLTAFATSGLTYALAFMTRETVAMETPASAAMSDMHGGP